MSDSRINKNNFLNLLYNTPELGRTHFGLTNKAEFAPKRVALGKIYRNEVMPVAEYLNANKAPADEIVRTVNSKDMLPMVDAWRQTRKNWALPATERGLIAAAWMLQYDMEPVPGSQSVYFNMEAKKRK